MWVNDKVTMVVRGERVWIRIGGYKEFGGVWMVG